MKKAKIIFLIFTIIFTVKAETNEKDNIDVRKIVQQQIENASKLNYNKKETNFIARFPKKEFDELLLKIPISKGDAINVFIIGEGFFIALLFLFWKRRGVVYKHGKTKKSKSESDEYNSMRELIALREKIKSVNDVNTESERKKLKDNPSIFNFSGKKISQKAKDMFVPKGELMLAAKIKAHEMAQECLES